MFALLILLLVTNPAKGPSRKSGVTPAESQIKSDTAKYGPADTAQKPLAPVAIESISPAGNQKKNPTKDTAKPTDNNSNAFDWKTWLIVVGTLLLAGFSLWQVFISRDTARRQLRAYIAVDIEIQKSLIELWKETAPCHFRLINNGQTPAYDVRTWCVAKIGEAPKRGVCSFDFENNPNGIVVTAKVIHRTESGAKKWHLPTPPPIPNINGNLTGVTFGESAVYYWGRTDYLDAFNRPQFTRFQWCAKIGKGGKLGDPVVIPCEGTEAT